MSIINIIYLIVIFNTILRYNDAIHQTKIREIKTPNRYYETVDYVFINDPLFPKSDDSVILDLVVEKGENWKEISDLLKVPQKNCRSRYNIFLKTFKSSIWSEEEEKRLLSLYDQLQQYQRIQSNISKSMNYIPVGGWRNISHQLSRHSLDCRQHLYFIKYNIDLSNSNDFWHNWEIVQLALLIREKGTKFSSIGRHLARTASQCYNCFNTRQFRKIYDQLLIISNHSNTFDESSFLSTFFTTSSKMDDIDNSNYDINLELKNYDITFQSPSLIKTDKIDVDSSKSRLNRWTLEEDNKLLNLVKEHGNKWVHISTYFTSRVPSVCFARYNRLMKDCADRLDVSNSNSGSNNNSYGEVGNENNAIKMLTPKLTPPIRNNKVLWTSEKVRMLCDLVHKYGAQWKNIAEKLGPRYDHWNTRAYYYNLVKRFPQTYLMPTRLRSGRSERSNAIDKSSSQEVSMTNIIKSIELTDISAYSAVEKNPGILELQEPVTQMVNISRMLENSRSRNSARLLGGEQGRSLRPSVDTRWTRSQDTALTRLVLLYGEQWPAVAEALGRSPEDVALRYEFKVSHRRRGPWTRAEDEALLQFVAMHDKYLNSSYSNSSSGSTYSSNSPDWALVGAQLGRSAGQCALRFRLSLDPRLKWRLWEPDEDDRLRYLRETLGYNWVMISAALDRSSASCRYRYLKHLKQDAS
jgi:hypothetical protein